MQQVERLGRLKDFFRKNFKNYDIQAEEEIFSLGFVNSLFAVQLVEFVETEFGIEIDADDLDIENFRTLNALVGLVSRKCESAQAA